MAIRMGPVTAGGVSGRAFSIRILNLKEVMQDLEEELDDVVDDVEEALTPAMEKWIKQPSQQICPIDTGALRKSAYVSVTRRGKYGIDAIAGYDTEYAIYVHERLDAYHAPPTRAKFLEETIAKNGDRMIEDVEKRVRRMQR